MITDTDSRYLTSGCSNLPQVCERLIDLYKFGDPDIFGFIPSEVPTIVSRFGQDHGLTEEVVKASLVNIGIKVE